jgi:Short C-terminal domain
MGFLDRFKPAAAPSLKDMLDIATERHVDVSDGIHAIATVERVVVADREQRGSGLEQWAVYLSLRLADENGVESVIERRLLFRGLAIPPPDTVVRVAYLPGRMADTLDLVRNDAGGPIVDPAQQPDPPAPRGWGAGVFDVEDLGSRGSFPLHGDGIDEDRELFRAGPVQDGEIVGAKDTGSIRMTSVKRELVVRAGGVDHEVEAWTPRSIWPEIGARLKVVVSPDRSRVALDTDERWSGAPGRALVFTNPPDPTLQENPELAAALDDHGRAELAALGKQHAAGRVSDAQFEMMKQRLAARASAPPVAAPGTKAQAMLERLEQQHQAGVISDDQYRKMKAAFERME